MNALLRLSCSAVTMAMLHAAAAVAQVPPRDPRTPERQPPAVGTAAIAGTVTMAGGVQPARKVRVSLSGAETRGGRSVTTDDQGRFSFTALPAGRYTLSASKPGHVSVTFGQRRPGGPGTPIQLSDGQKFQATLQIPKGSVITGTVLDENGEPAPQTGVRVMRVIVQNGRRSLQANNSGTSDDRGIYRVFGLLPGDYVVCATPRNTGMGDFERVQVEMQALQQTFETVSRTDAEQARAIGERIQALQGVAPPAEDSTPPPGYAPVCYPGTVSPSSATPVMLGIGEERPGVDFQLQLAPLTRIEGTVVNSTGAQLREITVTLSDPQQVGFTVGNITARADSEGRFRLTNVPPGQYRISARAMIAPTRDAALPAGAAGGGRGRGAAPGPQRAEPIGVWGATDVTVDGRATLSDVLLTLQQGPAISGQVAFDGSTAPPADLTRVRVTLLPSEPMPSGATPSARLDPSGRFTIPSVTPGRYRLNASGIQGWVAESAIIGGQDAIDFPFEVKGTQNITGAVITFTDRPTELTGIVSDEKTQPAPEYTIIVFPVDSRYWTGSSRRIQSIRPSTDGRYTFRNLPPGEYRIVPVLDLEPGSASDPAFLQQLEPTGLRFTLQAGEKKTQDLRVGGG